MILQKLKEKARTGKEKITSELGRYKVVLKTLPLSIAAGGLGFLGAHLAYFLITKKPLYVYESNPYVAASELGLCAASMAGLGYYINQERKKDEFKRTYQEWIDRN